MNEVAYVIDIGSEESFQENVINKSHELPIVVDFWAEWCQPCQVLVPLLVDIAQQYNGAFILAKIDSDANQEIAMKCGVKNLPTVMIFKDGQAVDSFTGAIPESEIKTFINKYTSNPSDDITEQALLLLEQDDSDTSLEQLKQLNKEHPENYKIHLIIAQLYLKTQQLDLCEDLLTALPADIQVENATKSLKSQLEIAQQVANAPDLTVLEKQITEQPDNLDLQLQLANLHIAAKNYSLALEVLLTTFKKDSNYNEGIAKTNMLKVFEILGSSDKLVRQYRNKLFSYLN
jgi:putative thioredoxin